MTGYYKIKKENLHLLPKNSFNIEDDIYELTYPLVVEKDNELPKEIEYLYKTLEIPIINVNELNSHTIKLDKDKEGFLKRLSEYLKMNKEIELLEEGKVGHTLRVGKIAKDLCIELGLSKEETKKIYIGAILHDTGKFLIPDEILGKPDKLTENEKTVMQKHTSYAYDILHNFLDKETLDNIISHHERIDGSGYPEGKIPNTGARIIGIADSFDTMTSDRIYKKGRSAKDALKELELCTKSIYSGGKGILYDKNIVDKFIGIKLKEE